MEALDPPIVPIFSRFGTLLLRADGQDELGHDLVSVGTSWLGDEATPYVMLGRSRHTAHSLAILSEEKMLASNDSLTHVSNFEPCVLPGHLLGWRSALRIALQYFLKTVDAADVLREGRRIAAESELLRITTQRDALNHRMHALNAIIAQNRIT